MGDNVIILLIIFFLFIILFLYCSLVVAGEYDREMEREKVKFNNK